MKLKKSIGFLLLFLFYSVSGIKAQVNEIPLSGIVTDSVSGEALIGSNILLYRDSISAGQPPYRGAASNGYGFYIIPKCSPAVYIIVIRHLGYKTLIRELDLRMQRGTYKFNAELKSEEIKLNEVVVKGKKEVRPEINTVDVSPDFLKRLPSLSGEIDLFKLLQLLPGIKFGSELSSGLYVRGGSPDQTLTLVDGMTVYNPAHLGNIASTFNSNAMQDVKLIKGAFPAQYGGRLSSVLDIKLRSGTKEKEKGVIGLGLINSYLTLEGPLSEKSTYMISGRSMYYDLVQGIADKNSSVPRYNFQDLNAKINMVLSESNIVTATALYSRDRVYNPPSAKDINYDISWQNSEYGINWIQVNKKSLFLNSLISFVDYEFKSNIGGSSPDIQSSGYFSSSKLRDLTLRQNVEMHLSQDQTYKTGFEIDMHNYNLLYSDSYSELLERDPYAGKDITSVEAAAFVQAETKFSERLKTNIGARIYYFESRKYFNAEPRISASYALTDNMSLQAAYAVAHQFIHLITRSDISLPTDLWYPSTKNIEPSRSSQYVLGLESTFNDLEYLVSLEGYYKDMKNLYEFKTSAKLNPLDNSIEEQFTKGIGEAYGVEVFINKRLGDLTGWLGYTLSWTKRKFDDLNGGLSFYPKYDRRNDVSAVLSYKVNDHLNIGATWTYASGQRYTLPPAQYQFKDIVTGGTPKIYLNSEDLYGAQFPAYHKLDLNISYRFNWLSHGFEAYLNFYNLYNRQNPFSQYTSLEETPSGKIPVVKRLVLFPFIPMFGFNVQF